MPVPPPAAVAAAPPRPAPPPACTAPAGVSAALASLVAAERAFARLSVDSGAQVAFMANLADEAVLFRPTPVAGRAFQAAHPIPATVGTLAWTPQWAAVSRAGDLGVTSGPYTISRAGRVVAHGSFNSVWRRRPGEPWRLLLDVGVTDSATATAAIAAAGVAACGPVRAVVPGTAAPGHDPLAAVLHVDSTLGRGPADPASGLAAVAAADARFMRDHRPAATGTAAARAVGDAAAGVRGVPIAGGVARSGDLAYTYGRYAGAGGPGDVPAGGGGHYLRVWRAGPRGWSLLLDVENPLPPDAAPAAAPAEGSTAAPPAR